MYAQMCTQSSQKTNLSNVNCRSVSFSLFHPNLHTTHESTRMKKSKIIFKKSIFVLSNFYVRVFSLVHLYVEKIVPFLFCLIQIAFIRSYKKYQPVSIKQYIIACEQNKQNMNKMTNSSTMM